MNLIATTIICGNVYSFSRLSEVKDKVYRLICWLPSLRHFNSHLVKIKTRLPVNSVAMICDKRHCPGTRRILFQFVRNFGIVDSIIEILLKSPSGGHSRLISAIKRHNFHPHSEEVVRHRMESDSTDFNGAVTDYATPFRLILTFWLQKMFPVRKEPRVWTQFGHAAGVIVEDCPPWCCV